MRWGWAGARPDDLRQNDKRGNDRRRNDKRRNDRRRDDGNAMVEFVGLSVVLLIPLVYFMLAVFSVQRAAFAVTQAAREAGRAYATADSSPAGVARARYAARLALADQGLRQEPELRFGPVGSACGSGEPGEQTGLLRPRTPFEVCVRTRAALPFAVFGPVRSGVPVSGRFTVVVDAYRRFRP